MPIMPQNGDTICGKKGKYRILAGDNAEFKGGQSQGYLVQNETGEKLFLKMFLDRTIESPEAKQFEEHQKVLMKKLAKVPGFVCQDVEFFQVDGTFYKVSEFMQGTTLQDRLDQAEQSSNPDYWSLADRQTNSKILAFTISEIHKHGIVHCDLKPENCFLAEKKLRNGKKKLIIRLLDFDGALIEGLSSTGMHVTEGYLAPEQKYPEIFGPPGTYSDVFSMGIMLYHILVKKYPFVSENGFLLREAIHLADAAPWLPDHVAEIIWRALEPQPARRPTSQEIHQVLISEKSLSHTPAPPPPLPDRVALVAPEGRVRFWKDTEFGRTDFRGINGYQYVAPSQAQILKHKNSWVIKHLEKAVNPTKLNDNKLEAEKYYLLKENDVIQIGTLRVTVKFEFEK